MEVQGHPADPRAWPGGSPRIDIPDGVKQAAASGLEQFKQGYERFSTTAEAMTGAMEKSYSMAITDAAVVHAKILEACHTSVMAAFEFAAAMAAAKSLPEVIRLSTKFARTQFEAFAAQSKEFWSFGQKMISDTAKPVATGFSRGIDQAASS